MSRAHMSTCAIVVVLLVALSRGAYKNGLTSDSG